MKKMISLLLVLCMLLAALTAFAAEAAEKVVLQNEKAPQVIAIGEENGVAIVGTVQDVNGNVVNVLDDGSLLLTDVHDRSNTGNEEVAKRLTSAYEGVMEDVHFSDVGSLKHEDILTVDIDAALAGHPDNLIAYDLIMYELFDVMLTGEKAAALTEGGNLAFTVQLEEEQPLPLMIIYTPDGNEWKILESYTIGENKTIKICLEQPGTLAFLLNGQRVEVEKDVDDKDSANGGSNNGGSTGGDNNNGGGNGSFTPSVSGKNAPVLVPFVNQNGNACSGYFAFGENTQIPGQQENADIVTIPVEGYLVVTALAERDYAQDIQTHEHLEWAYDDILSAENMAALEQGIDEKIDALLSEGGYELKSDDLIVRDLFEITVYGEYLKYFYQEDARLNMAFDVEVSQDEAFVVLYSSDSVTWQVLPAEAVKINENGAVALELPELGVVAFLVEKTPDVSGEEAVQSPE